MTDATNRSATSGARRSWQAVGLACGSDGWALGTRRRVRRLDLEALHGVLGPPHVAGAGERKRKWAGLLS